MEIVHATEVPLSEWTTLVTGSDDAWLYHTPAWLRLTADLFGVENHVFLARDNGALVAGFPVQLATRQSRGGATDRAVSVLMGPAGPLCARQLSDATRRRFLSDLTARVTEWSHERDVPMVACSLPPLAPRNLANVRGVNPLAMTGWADVSTHTRIIDLAPAEDRLWAALSPDARRSVKSAEAAGYKVAAVAWDEALDDYFRLHVETYRRTGAAPHPRDYFEAIATRIASAGHAILWAATDGRGRRVAFHNCGRFGAGALYWTGACATDHLAAGVNYQLFWAAMLGAKADGCVSYEAGEVFPGAQDGKHRGLTVFKGKFGGEVYRYYRAELRPGGARSSTRGRILSAVGRGLRAFRGRR